MRFLVDTAVDPSAVDRQSASSIGLKRTGAEGAVEGVGSDAATAYESTLNSLVIGGKDFGPVDVLVADLGKVKARFAAPLDGILGYSLLKNHAVLIDYPSNRITFDPPLALKQSPECRLRYAFPLEFISPEDKTILVPGFKIAGVDIAAFLDTGSSNSLRIETESPAIAHIRSLLPTGTLGTSVGARGEAPLRRGMLDAPVTIGPFTVQPVEVALVGGGNPDVPVNIGNKFLRQIGARLLVDIPHQKVAIYGDCVAS